MRVRSVTPGPLYPDDSPRGARIARRVRGTAIELVAFVLVTALFVGLLVAAALADLILWLARRKRPMGMRLVALLWWFLFGDIRGYFWLVWIWSTSGGPWGGGSLRRRRLTYDLRIRWTRSHLDGVKFLFGLGFEAEGLELVGPGPVIILIRHASIIDNTLPDAVLARPHGLGLRFLIKRELQMLPLIDIAGRWVPTCFVRRASGDSETEVAALRALAHDLGPGEGVLVYPEGTRHTAEKLARSQEKIRERQPVLAPLADRLRHVLPPRLGGALALLDEAAGADVVICGHVGLDGFEYIRDIWAGGLVGTTIRLKCWRHDGTSVPTAQDERIAWLYECWQELDDWVGAHQTA